MEEREQTYYHSINGESGTIIRSSTPRYYSGDAGTWLLDRNSLAESQCQTSKCPSTNKTKASQRAATAAHDMYEQPVKHRTEYRGHRRQRTVTMTIDDWREEGWGGFYGFPFHPR